MSESISLEKSYNDFATPLKETISDNSLNDPLENIVKEEKTNELNKLIKESLSDNEYQVYSLMLSGLKYAEIAFILGKTTKQVDNAMQRIKCKIKNIMKKQME